MAQFNLAGFLNAEQNDSDKDIGNPLWVWNIGSEGTTIEADISWLGLVTSLRPSRVFVLRGALESIIRPTEIVDNRPPIWIPRGWRHYAAMDPRCYYSSTWWRRAKQQLVNDVKQLFRRKLLARGGQPLLSASEFRRHLVAVLKGLTTTGSKLVVLGLPPVSEETFPGSSSSFRGRNLLLRQVAEAIGVDFFDWHDAIESTTGMRELHYLDGFHPNQAGSEYMAALLGNFLGFRHSDDGELS